MNFTNYYSRIICFALSIGIQFSLIGQNEILQQEISIAFEDLSIKESLDKLSEVSGVSTAYNDRELENSKITITFEKELLSEVLDALLTNEKLDYKVVGNTVAIFRNEDLSKNENVVLVKQKKSTEKFTISGNIIDGKSKETLIGANVYVPELGKGGTSNEYGFYSMTLPKGEYTIVFSYVGYESVIKEISLNQNIEFSAPLFLGNELGEVVIKADDNSQRHSETKMSVNKLSMENLKAIPVLMGERDVIKMMQLLPGVQSGSEGSSGLYVRGGGPDQNLILVDGVPIYNVNHLFGFLSTLNGDAIKSAEITKGGFPAHYGGRLSSIIDVRTIEGNMEEFHGEISAGLVSGKFNLEGPIIKNKTSFHISGRRTWLDLITTPAQKIANSGQTIKELNAYHFFDLNFKVNHKFSDKSRLYLSSYLGDDHLKYRFEEGTKLKEDGDLVWGNRIVSLRWNYQMTPKLFSSTTIYNTAYKFKFRDELKDGNVIDYYSSDSDINDFGAKIDFNYLPNPNHHVRIGIGSIQHEFNPTVNTQSSTEGSEPPEVTMTTSELIKANESSAYIEDDITIGNRLKLNIGMHFSNFKVQNSNYFTYQPRAAMSFLLSEKSSVKISYSQMRQFLHLLASPGLGLPTDLWVASTDLVKPEESTQYAVGYTQSLGKGFEITLEGYYKTMNNLLEYKSGFNIFTNSSNWENKILTGKGTSYGIELLAEKRIGKLTGWIGYTLSKSERRFPDLNSGKAFPYKYDRTHDVSLALTYKKGERIDFGLIWVYGTGNTYTLGTQNYYAIETGSESHFANNFLSSFDSVNHIEKRNNQRAPAYHRLDLSVNFHKIKKRGKRTWSLGLYNAYSRQNPFNVSVQKRKQNDELYLKQTSLLPVVPFVSYSFKF